MLCTLANSLNLVTQIRDGAKDRMITIKPIAAKAGIQFSVDKQMNTGILRIAGGSV